MAPFCLQLVVICLQKDVRTRTRTGVNARTVTVSRTLLRHHFLTHLRQILSKDILQRLKKYTVVAFTHLSFLFQCPEDL